MNAMPPQDSPSYGGDAPRPPYEGGGPRPPYEGDGPQPPYGRPSPQQPYGPHPQQQPYGGPPPRPEPWVAAASPGTPYHRLARTRHHRWWRPPLGTLLLLGVWVIAMVAVIAGFAITAFATGMDFLVSETRFFANPVVNIGALLGVIVVALPAALLAALVVQRRPAGSLSSVTGRLRWRWLFTCFGVAFLAITVALAAVYLLPPSGGVGAGPNPAESWVGWQRFLIATVVLLALVPLQSSAEEYVFRGWVIQTVGAYVRIPWFGIAAGAVLFALAHGLGTGWGFADLLLFAGVSGWLAVRTGGLEPAIALHTTNNLMAFMISAAFGSLGVIETAAQASWALFAVDLVVLPLYAWVLIRLADRRDLPRTVPTPPEAAQPQPVEPAPAPSQDTRSPGAGYDHETGQTGHGFGHSPH